MVFIAAVWFFLVFLVFSMVLQGVLSDFVGLRRVTPDSNRFPQNFNCNLKKAAQTQHTGAASEHFPLDFNLNFN